jgi:hypothetical protein
VVVFNAPFNTSFADVSGHSTLNGVFGSPTLSSSEAYPPNTNSLAIPGSSGNYLTYSPVNLGADNFTMSAAVYLTGSVSQYAGLFSQWGDQEAFQLNINSNDSVQFSAWTAADGEIVLNTSNPLSLNAWHLLTAQRVGNTVTVSADGSVLGTVNINGAINTNNNGLWVGEPDCAGYTVCWTHTNPFYLNNLVITDNSISSVPEPSTWAMMLLGFAGIGLAGYFQKRKAHAPIISA